MKRRPSAYPEAAGSRSAPRSARCWPAPAAAPWAASPSIGSESHFLAYCEQGCGPGLDCIGGICTRPCLTDRAGCSDLAANADCTNQSVEPGEVAVCDVSCAGAGGCAALGADYACDQGYCRQASGSGVSGDCYPVGRYAVGPGEAEDKPCCPGLTQLPTLVESNVNDEPTPSCVQEPLHRYFSCIQGSCGDGICEDAEAPCGCGVDCPDSNWRTRPSFCEVYPDQSPPPDVREISITNTGSVPLYIGRSGDCPYFSRLFEVQRDGQKLENPDCPDAGCQYVMDNGWGYAYRCRPDSDGACTNYNIFPRDFGPLVFTFSTSNYYQSHAFEISAPSN